jgi:hypothetical protein
MDMQTVGKWMLIGGLGLAAMGGLLMVLARFGLFSNFGTLPGDIHIEGQNFTCFAPIVSMIILSLVLTVIVNIIIRLINRP